MKIPRVFELKKEKEERSEMKRRGRERREGEKTRRRGEHKVAYGGEGKGEALVPCGNGGKKKGLEDRHRDEEQDALRDASNQKGRSRVCGARYVWPRERESRAGGKKRRFVGFYELSFPFDPRASSCAQSERLAGRGS